MSLYALSKLIYELNRSPDVQSRYKSDPVSIADAYKLTDEERQAVLAPDIGLLYVLGVNGQLLMHFAAFHGIEWADYLQRMRDGVQRHGEVRAGVYAMTTRLDEKVAGV